MHFFTIKNHVSCELSVESFFLIQLRNAFLCLFSESFLKSWMVVAYWQMLFLHVSVYTIIQFSLFQAVDMMDHNDFSNNEQLIHSWDKSSFIIVWPFFIYCWIQFAYFLLGVFMWFHSWMMLVCRFCGSLNCWFKNFFF